MAEELKDISGYDALMHDWGEKYRGWYFRKIFLRKISIEMNHKDKKISYPFISCDYNYHFFIPSAVKFIGGLLTYSEDERKFGVFRFPRNENGRFCAPVSLDKKESGLLDFSEEQVAELLKRRKPLVFDAYRVPQYGFEYFSMDDKTFEELSDLADEQFAQGVRQRYETELQGKIDIVKKKITEGANYLLILEALLNLEQSDFEKASLETDGIIHL